MALCPPARRRGLFGWTVADADHHCDCDADAPPTETAPADATGANSIAYGDLSPRAQRAFDGTRVGTSVLGPDSSYLDSVDFHWSLLDVSDAHRYVVQNGTYYRVTTDVDDSSIAQYVIESSEASPSNDSEFVAYDTLSPNVSDEVRWAIENGSSTAPWGKWYSLPEPLGDTEYVRYDGTVYELSYVVGDARLFTFAVYPA